MLRAEDAFMVLSLVAIAQAFTTLWALKRVGSQRPSSPLETSDLEIGVHTHWLLHHAGLCSPRLGIRDSRKTLQTSTECTSRTCMLN
jgi:hypothetical protein